MRPRDPSPAPLITAAELAEILAFAPPARPVVLDVRYPGIGLPDDGRDQYLAGHVPGAAYVSLDDALAAPHVPGATGRHPLPEVAVLQAAMRAAGVSAARPVVVYDDWRSIAAARAWWLLRWASHDDVRVRLVLSGPSTRPEARLGPDVDLGTECAHPTSDHVAIGGPPVIAERPAGRDLPSRDESPPSPVFGVGARCRYGHQGRTLHGPQPGVVARDGGALGSPFDIGASAGALASADPRPASADVQAASHTCGAAGRGVLHRSDPPPHAGFGLGRRSSSQPRPAGRSATASAAVDPAQPADGLGLLSGFGPTRGLRPDGVGRFRRLRSAQHAVAAPLLVGGPRRAATHVMGGSDCLYRTRPFVLRTAGRGVCLPAPIQPSSSSSESSACSASLSASFAF